MTFENAAVGAPIAVIARAHCSAGLCELDIQRVVWGRLSPGTAARSTPAHTLPRLQDSKDYLVLLSADGWPYPLTSDPDPRTRVQLFGCGVENAREIVGDRVLLDEGESAPLAELLAQVTERRQDAYHRNASGLMFPGTATWKAFDDLPLADIHRPGIMAALRSADAGTKVPDPECLDLIFAKGPASRFRTIDLDLDGRADIIYSGPTECAEGNLTVTWYGSTNGYERRGTESGNVLALRLLPGRDPQMSWVTIGCCTGRVDEYAAGSVTSMRSARRHAMLKDTTLPDAAAPALATFENPRETVLRSAPVANDAYDADASNREESAVLGNIVSKFLPGVHGTILAIQADASGVTWAFVSVTGNGALRFHAPYDVDVGWVLLEGLVVKQLANSRTSTGSQ